MSAILDWALKYAARGLHIFPCHYVKPDGLCSCGVIPKGQTELCRKGKHPFWGSAGFKDATTDEARIRAWWGGGQQWSVGMATGEVSGVWVFDEDTYKEVYEDVVRQKHGQLPKTPVSRTGSGGQQTFFLHDPARPLASASPWKDKGIDIKANGGYVILPPSHAGSRSYAWDVEAHIDDIPFARAPDYLYAEIAEYAKTKASSIAGGVETGADGKLPRGSRRPKMMSLAGTMARRAFAPAAIKAALMVENVAKCDPPLSEADIDKLVAGACKYPPGDPRPEIHNTDLGNAMRLVERHGSEIRYCPVLGWLVWDGQRWAKDECGCIMEYAKDAARWLSVEAETIQDPDKRKKAREWALTSESANKLEAMVKLAKTVAEVVVDEADLDKDPWLLNCLNGTLELKTGTLREHRQSDMLTMMTPVKYVPSAKREMWEASLTITCQKTPELKGYLKRLAGYCLTGTTGEQELYIAYGIGGNGKTTFFEPLRAAMGEYAGTTRVETLLSAGGNIGGGIPNDIAALRGLRLVLTGEPDKSRKLKTGLVKQLTGGDTISARFLHKEFFDIVPEFKLVIATNYQPEVDDIDEGIWRRVRMLPFDYRIDAAERIRDFHKLLIAEELEGILAWAVEGCLEWQKAGMDTPTCVSAATGDYRAEQDVYGPFFEDRCMMGEDFYRITPTALLNGLKGWCSELGIDAPSGKELATILKTRGIKKDRAKTADRTKFYVGIALKALSAQEM